MSSSLEVPSFSVTDADDFMEVSSDHGHHGADEDIDIDIDIPGHTEEDVVLDDATFNNGFGDEFQHQRSPANDELMVDEVEEQYDFHQEDVLIDDTITEGMDHEAHAMPFEETANMFAQPQAINTIPSESDNAEDVPLQTTDILAATEEAHTGPSGENAVATTDDQYLAKEAADSKTAGSVQPEQEAPKVDEPERNSRPSTPPFHSVDAIEAPNSPPNTSPAAQKETPSLPPNTGSHTIDRSGTSPDVILTNEHNDSISSREVGVTYRDSEYALFSTSDADDVDSFFLSDFSIIYKPLRELFEAIRAVIHEDLLEDDELYILVEDLKLELTENNLSDQDVTFDKIMDLHSRLLRNDGVESPQSLHLNLGTRPNFALRFDALKKSAAEGKGLSDVTHWDQSSDNLDGAEEIEEYEGPDVPAEQTKGVKGEEDATEEQIKAPKADHLREDITDLPLEHDHRKSPIDTHERVTPDLSEAVSNTTVTQLPNLVDEYSSHRQVDEALVHSTELGTDGGVFEEDDLIDYSEEELDTPTGDENKSASRSRHINPDDSRTHNGISADSYSRCFKPQTCFCSDCNDLLIAEYEAKNKELQRRSLSRAAEANPSEPPISQSGDTEEDNVDNENENEAGDHPGDINGTIENLSWHNGGSLQADLPEESANRFEASVDDEDNYDVEHGEWEGYETTLEAQNGFQLDEHETHAENGNEVSEDEIDFVGDAFAQSDAYSGLPTADVNAEFDPFVGNTQLPLVDPTDINSKTANAEEAESIGSDKTLEAQPDLGIEDEDEINYDDDEDAETLKVHGAVSEAEAPPVLGAVSSKRGRTEELLDEDIETRGKEAKRPRS